MMVQTRYTYAYVKKIHIMYIPGTVPVTSKALEILQFEAMQQKAYVSNNILGKKNIRRSLRTENNLNIYIYGINIYNISLNMYVRYTSH